MVLALWRTLFFLEWSISHGKNSVLLCAGLDLLKIRWVYGSSGCVFCICSCSQDQTAPPLFKHGHFKWNLDSDLVQSNLRQAVGAFDPVWTSLNQSEPVWPRSTDVWSTLSLKMDQNGAAKAKVFPIFLPGWLLLHHVFWSKSDVLFLQKSNIFFLSKSDVLPCPVSALSSPNVPVSLSLSSSRHGCTTSLSNLVQESFQWIISTNLVICLCWTRSSN